MGRILIDGFPRSGNTFFYELLSASFLNIDIPQFRHSVKTFSPETYVLLRDPQYSISSFMSTFRHDDAKSAEDWWVRYYNTAVENNVKFILFEDLTKDTTEVLDRISRETGLPYITAELYNLNKNESKESYRTDYNFDKAKDLYFSLLKNLNK